MTEQHEQWQALEIRRPDDVPAVTPLSWQFDKLYRHSERLMNLALPSDFPYPVEVAGAEDAVAAIALGESIRRDIEYARGTRARQALELGATVADVAGALDMDEDQVRELLRTWADGQRLLWQSTTDDGRPPLGLSPDAYADFLAFLDQADADR